MGSQGARFSLTQLDEERPGKAETHSCRSEDHTLSLCEVVWGLVSGGCLVRMDSDLNV